MINTTKPKRFYYNIVFFFHSISLWKEKCFQIQNFELFWCGCLISVRLLISALMRYGAMRLKCVYHTASHTVHMPVLTMYALRCRWRSARINRYERILYTAWLSTHDFIPNGVVLQRTVHRSYWHWATERTVSSLSFHSVEHSHPKRQQQVAFSVHFNRINIFAYFIFVEFSLNIIANFNFTVFSRKKKNYSVGRTKVVSTRINN